MTSPDHIQESLSTLSRARGFSMSALREVSGYPILALARKSDGSAARPYRVYLSSGVHGDEPAGPLALLNLIENDLLPRHVELLVLPLINPTGFAARTRENGRGHDINRDFRYPKTSETAAVKAFVDAQAPFDLSLALHEDWESRGFYLYSLSPDSDPTAARQVLQAAETVGPLDPSAEIDGSPADRGLIDRPADFDIYGRDDWPEAFYLYSKSRHAHYTLESPSSAPMQQRIAQQSAAVLRAIELHCS